IALLIAMNVYEVSIILLGLILIRRTRGAARDGWWLVLFEILFLVNATFISPDFRQSWGIPLSIALFVVASIKTAVVMRGLKMELWLRTFGFFVLQLAIIYGLPVLFALVHYVDGGRTSPRIMYGLWWLVGILPLVYD